MSLMITFLLLTIRTYCYNRFAVMRRTICNTANRTIFLRALKITFTIAFMRTENTIISLTIRTKYIILLLICIPFRQRFRLRISTYKMIFHAIRCNRSPLRKMLLMLATKILIASRTFPFFTFRGIRTSFYSPSYCNSAFHFTIRIIPTKR